MNEAIHAQTRNRMTAEHYLRDIGKPALGQRADDRGRMVCEACWQTVNHRAGRTDKSQGHFAHEHDSGFCPTKSSAERLYGPLTPRLPDMANAAAIKRQTFQRWRWVFHTINRHAPFLSSEEFLELIDVANAERMWQYKGLTLEQVPEMLLTARDFTPTTSMNSQRKYWFRFWFSANIRFIDDLWNTPPQNVKLFRGSFPIPHGNGRPRMTSLVRQTELVRIHTARPDDPVEFPFNDAAFVATISNALAFK
jgi:hypothetical protein